MTTKTMTKIRKRNNIEEEYFDWLCRRVDNGEKWDYDEFICELHKIEFYSIVPNDDNRVADGLKLRTKFIEEMNLTEKHIEKIRGPCSVLEMLVALADRIDFILFNPEKGDQCQVYFWMFVRNLRLLTYDPDDPEKEHKKRRNKSLITTFLERGYEENGKGGLFPIRNPSYNQRGVEIWYQMMKYISENYSI